MKTFLSLCFSLFLTTSLFSQYSPQLVKDVNPIELNSIFGGEGSMIYIDGTLYFAANDTDLGWELWKTDGTKNGTSLVKDILPGKEGSNPYHFVNANGTLFFLATDTNGIELWKSDGTELGTVLVTDLRSGYLGSSIRELVVKGDSVYFSAVADSSGDRGIYLSDGTSSGTKQIKDIHTAGDDAVVNIFLYKAEVYFVANDGNEYELWKTDGSDVGTTKIDVVPGTAGLRAAREFTIVGEDLYFINWNFNVSMRELWLTDGTASGSSILKSFSNFTSQLVRNDSLLFFIQGSRLWKSDGTAAGTVQAVSNIEVSELAVHNGEIYFTGDSVGGASNIGRELWKSDGTAAGTVLMKDIYPGVHPQISTLANASYPNKFVSVDSILYFLAYTDSLGIELWKTDGTSNGTVLVSDMIPGAKSGFDQYLPHRGSAPHNHEMIAGDGELFFIANDGDYDFGLWRTDGTMNGTQEIVNPFIGSYGSSLEKFVGYNGRVFFRSQGASWVTDGTPGGTKQTGFTLNSSVVFKGEFYFASISDSTGNELWKLDSTGNGRILIKDINIGTAHSEIYHLTVSDSLMFFFTNENNTSGLELWKSDGTEAGTALVKDINPGSANSVSLISQRIVDVNGTLFFNADNGTNGKELWKSDGTAAGTVMVKDINPGSSSSSLGDFININGILFFTADDGSNGVELWKSNGTSAGTVLVKNIRGGSSGSMFSSLFDKNKFTNVNGTLYFSANNGVNGIELWKSDGTFSGTQMVKDIQPGSISSSPDELVAHEDTLYFLASSIASGRELWKTDGSNLGTEVITNTSHTSSTFPRNPIIFEDTLYFKTDDGINGMELWKSDGTLNGSSMVADINPGSASGVSYSPMIVEGSTLFFMADNGIIGAELWKLGPCLPTQGIDELLACDSLTWIDGKTYFSDNFFAVDTLLNVEGCDSIITLNLSIVEVDTSVTQSGGELTANATNATYQWLDCNNGFSAISGATSQSFVFSQSGAYAVELSQNSCVDTSSCFVTIVGLFENTLVNSIELHPNPAKDYLTIKTSLTPLNVSIIDLSGKTIQVYLGSDYKVDLSDLPAGIYFMQIESKEGVVGKRFVKM